MYSFYSISFMKFLFINSIALDEAFCGIASEAILYAYGPKIGCKAYMSLVVRKPVFRVSDQVQH